MKLLNQTSSIIIIGDIVFNPNVSMDISDRPLTTQMVSSIGAALVSTQLLALDADAKRFIGMQNVGKAFYNLPDNQTNDDGTVPVTANLVTGCISSLVGFPIMSPGSIRVGAIGDSTIAGVLQSVDGVTVIVGNAYAANYPPAKIGFEKGAATAWLTHLCFQSNGRLILNHNGGVSSDTSAGCLARVPYEISQSPQIMFMQMGARNDFNSSVPLATTKANMISAIGQFQAAGILPVLVCCLPDNTTAIGNKIRAWNEWLKWVGINSNIAVIDPYPSVTDVTSASGNWLSTYSSDGIHPNTLGSQVIASYILKQLLAHGLVTSIPDATAFNRLANTDLGVGVTSSLNMLNNPLFKQNSGAVVATSWSLVTGTCTPSINGSPGAGVLGSSQVLSFTTGQTLTDYRQQIVTVVGQRYAFSGLFKTTGMAAAAGIYSIGQVKDTGAAYAVMSVQNLIGVDYSGWTPFYVEFVAISTSTRVSPALCPTTIGGTATIEFAMMRFVNLSTL